VREIFEQLQDKHLQGSIIWEPMMAEDDLAAALIQKELFQDKRVEHYWDAEKVLGKMVADSMLENTPIAWDIYLLYQPGAQRDSEKLPLPDFWMHQLEEDENLRLNPESLQKQVKTTIHNLSN
jgi:hypothetical protein